MTREESSFLAFTKTLAHYARDLDKYAKSSWSGINLSNSEPEIIRDYLLKPGAGIDHLNRNFAAKFSQHNPRFSLKFSSVFIHQRPKVHRLPSAHASCELGDLCNIFVFVDKHKNIRHARAIISQAKKGLRLDLNSNDQRLLYDEASAFEYAAKSFYSRTFNQSPHRKLPTYQRGRALGLKYLLVRGVSHPVVHSPPSFSDRRHGWGSTIFRIATGSDGLQFFPGNPSHDEWSAILDDLIRMGRGLIKSSSTKSKPRANPSELDYIIDEFNHFESFEKWSIEGEEGDDGVPILLIIVQDKELEAPEPIPE